MIGLADCNNFYCSCERIFHPDLVGKPVVVLSNNDGCIIARSNESKALGLDMGAPFYQVKDRLEREGVAVFSSNYTLYGDISRRVMSILSRYTPRIDVYSIDEAFLDLDGIPDVGEYCRRMVAYVGKATGMPVSVGVAPTKTLAKVASKYAKKYPGYRGVCVIDSDDKREKALRLCDIADVWGIGRRHAKRLKDIGVRTAYDFTLKPASWVKANMAVTGLRTWHELRGTGCISVDELPRKKSICTSRSLPGIGLQELSHVEEALANHAAMCAKKLREQGSACRTMLAFAHTSMFNTSLPRDYFQGIVTFPVATNSLTEIVEGAVESLRRHWRGRPYLMGVKDGYGYFYKKAGVIVSDIVPEDCVQGSLFDRIDRDRQRRLTEAIDAINRRNGYNTVRAAVQGYSGAWHLQRSYISRQYTTNLDHIITVKA